MIESIFHDGKKSCVGDQKLKRLNKMICSNPQCFVRKDTVLSPLDLAALLIKRNKIAKLNSLPT
jgi:hypothetical protein